MWASEPPAFARPRYGSFSVNSWDGRLLMARLRHGALLLGVLSSLSTPISAQASNGSGATVSGVVRDDATGQPLPFSVVEIRGRSLQRFTTDSGRFRIAGLAPGPATLRVRHLGFTPREASFNLRAGQDSSVEIRLTAVAVNLAAMPIHASAACDDPGPPRAIDDSAFAAVFTQLRENADQYNLLATAYPFRALLARTLSAEQHNGALDVKNSDTVVFRSDREWPYQPGQIVAQPTDPRITGGRGDYVMHIPTLDVLADSAFLANHCFGNAGLQTVGGLALLRIDFRAAERIDTPDVDGSMYLDPKSYQIRRSVVRLSRRPRAIPYIDSATVTTTFAELYPSLPIVTGVESRNRLSYPFRPTAPRASIETQALVRLAWLHGKPGDAPSLAVAEPLQAHPNTERVLLAVDSATGNALTGAQFVDATSHSIAVTGADGKARLDLFSDSAIAITARMIGYAPRTLTVSAASDPDAVVRVALAKDIVLSTMQVTGVAPRYISPALQGFEERKKLNMGGYFVDDSVLRKEEGRKLGDVLRSHVPGVMLSEGAHSAINLLKSPRCVSGGPPQVYLDGVPLAAEIPSSDVRDRPGNASGSGGPTTRRQQNAAIPPFDLTNFLVSNLAGVEYYPDGTSLPIQFDHSSERCGALLLWTRER